MFVFEKALAYALKYNSQAEIFCEKREDTHIKFRNNALDFVGAKHLDGISLRIIRNNKLGFSSATYAEPLRETSPEHVHIIRRLVKNAIATSKFGHIAHFSFPSKIRGTSVRILDNHLAEADEKECIAIGEQTIDSIKRFNNKVKSSIEIQKMNNTVYIANSNDTSYSYSKTVMSIEITSSINLKGNIIEIHDSWSSCSKIDHEKLVKSICYELEMLTSLKTQKIDSMLTSTIFMPKATYALLYPLRMSINGKFAHKGLSRWTGKIGKKVSSNKIWIFDDGTLDSAPGSAPIDDEGVCTQKTSIVMQGVLKNFIYDLQSAGEAETQPTGNGLREFLTPPSPSTTNLVIPSGKISSADIIESLDTGILISQTLGVGQASTSSGLFLVDIGLGFKIENGKIVSRVKNAVVNGNIFDSLNNISSLSKETEYKYGAWIPSLCFSKMAVKAK